MSTLKGHLGVTAKDNDDNSSGSDNSSDADYELQEIRPEIHARSSLSRRQRKKCCTGGCVLEWLSIVVAFILFYVLNGLYTWALIAACLANSDAALISYAVIWFVFMVIFFGATLVISTKIERARLRRLEELAEEDRRRREENIARNAKEG
jgi:hypothetical protein